MSTGHGYDVSGSKVLAAGVNWNALLFSSTPRKDQFDAVAKPALAPLTRLTGS